MPISFRLQTPVKNKRFAGYIEDLEFDFDPVGLWNYGNYSYDPSAPSVPLLTQARNQLIELREGGIKFDGFGYAVYSMEGRVDVSRETSVVVVMKTFAKEGLLFYLAGNDNVSGNVLARGAAWRWRWGVGANRKFCTGQFFSGKERSFFCFEKVQIGPRALLVDQGREASFGASLIIIDKTVVTLY